MKKSCFEFLTMRHLYFYVKVYDAVPTVHQLARKM